MLHLKAVAETRRQILVDWLMIIFGGGASIFTTVQTIKVRGEFHPRTHRMLPDDLSQLMAASGGTSGPRSGQCPSPSEGNLLTW